MGKFLTISVKPSLAIQVVSLTPLGGRSRSLLRPHAHSWELHPRWHPNQQEPSKEMLQFERSQGVKYRKRKPQRQKSRISFASAEPGRAPPGQERCCWERRAASAAPALPAGQASPAPGGSQRATGKVASVSAVKSKGLSSGGGKRLSSVPGRSSGCGCFPACRGKRQVPLHRTGSACLSVFVSELARRCVPNAGEARASSSCVLLTSEAPSKKGLRGDEAWGKPSGAAGLRWGAQPAR